MVGAKKWLWRKKWWCVGARFASCLETLRILYRATFFGNTVSSQSNRFASVSTMIIASEWCTRFAVHVVRISRHMCESWNVRQSLCWWLNLNQHLWNTHDEQGSNTLSIVVYDVLGGSMMRMKERRGLCFWSYSAFTSLFGRTFLMLKPNRDGSFTKCGMTHFWKNLGHDDHALATAW